MVTEKLKIGGMTCAACERKIEKKLKAMDGLFEVRVSLSKGCATVTFDENRVSLVQIKQTISALNYELLDGSAASKRPFKLYQLGIIAIIILGIFVILNHFGLLQFFNQFPEAQAGMSYAALFTIGLLTSVHCVGMCGGICLSQCVGAQGFGKAERLRPSFLYNVGRIISYTVIGGLVGALGSVVSFNGAMRGIVALLAGIFMVIMGLNMLDLFPWLKKLSIRMPKFLVGKAEGKNNSPFFVGLINGFMPCGPLQAMQLYALSTGDPLQGALSMFLFSLGTMPLMFGFGAASALISKKFSAQLMAISAVLVIILGFGMLNTGVSMSGYLAVGTEQSQTAGFEPVMENGYQVVTVEVSRNAYAPFTVKKGIPVKLNFHAEEKNINGCNNAIIIPSYGIEQKLFPGDNIVEFTPTKTGVIPYACWMNMIKSSFTVVE